MNFVEALTVRLQLPQNAARGLAGQVLGLVEDVVRERVSYGVASRVRDAVPELLEWQSSSPTIAPGSLRLDDLPLPTGGGDEADLDGLLERFRVKKHDAPVVTSLTMQFLASRLEPSVVAAITRAMPALTRAP